MAEENLATNKIESSDKTVANGTSKEAKEKKQAQGQEQNDKQNQNSNQQNPEKESSQTTQKPETAVTKDNSSTEEITEEVNKEGWQKENGQWRYMKIKRLSKIGRRLLEFGIILTRMVPCLAILSLTTIFSIRVEP